MYKITKEKADNIEPLTFSKLNMTENDMEELLRNNIDMICDEEESMLVVGRQVRNAMNGRSDLTAIDDRGNIVLIEIKRDRKDIENRKESFEFQAIRYAASYATVPDVEDLVNGVYAPYIEKYRQEFEVENLTSIEIANRNIADFLKENEAKNFNQMQRIILVASEFDEQTLSAVAWLNGNGVDMSCYKLVPYQINQELFIDIEKVLPLNKNNDYYVNIMGGKPTGIKQEKVNLTRRNLPKINDMLEWGVVEEGDTLYAKGRKENEAKLLKNGHVLIDDEEKSLQKWLKEVYGWSTVQTYNFAVHKATDKKLTDIREEYMERVVEKSL